MTNPELQPHAQRAADKDAVVKLRTLGTYLLAPGVVLLVVLGIWAGAADLVGDLRPLIAEILIGLGLVLVLSGVIAIILAGHAEATRR